MFFTDKLNSTQMLIDDTFGITDLDKWTEGFYTGLFWPDCWKHKPGGPHISYGTDHKRSRELHLLWLSAWHFGYQEKIRLGISISLEEYLQFH